VPSCLGQGQIYPLSEMACRQVEVWLQFLNPGTTWKWVLRRTLDNCSDGRWGRVGNLVSTGQDGLDRSWSGPVHSEETKNVLPVDF